MNWRPWMVFAGLATSAAWVARLGFVLFGLSVLALVPLKTQAWGTIAAGFHAAFGALMVAVAAFSHANPFGEPSDATVVRRRGAGFRNAGLPPRSRAGLTAG